MAVSKESANSPFGKRIMNLIEEKDKLIEDDGKKIKTIKGLATWFYDHKLVKVSEKKTYDDPVHERNNRINSIEKKILTHVNTGIITDKNGDYLLAYSKFFGCSCDYLLGRTNVKSTDISIRAICEKTGLSEKAVSRLVRENKGEGRNYNLLWSKMIESYIYYAIARDWITASNAHIDKLKEEGEIAYLDYLKQYMGGRDLMELNLDYEGAESRKDYSEAAFYGTLAKISKAVTDFVEDEITDSFEPFRENFENEMKEKARKSMKEYKGYYPLVLK